MTIANAESSSPVFAELPTAAGRQASANWSANATALAQAQPRLVEALAVPLPTLEWVFGRDGALTARIDGRWAIGCSIPRRASQSILKSLDPQGTIACLLTPTHGQQIEVAMSHLRPEQGLIVITSDVPSLQVQLHCCDFSAAISAGRLWFAWGERWGEELARLFVENPGLSLPQQLTRTILLEQEQMDAMTAAAKRVFADETARRAARVRELNAGWKPAGAGPRALAVIAPTLFRLWDDAGAVLADALAGGSAGLTLRRFDTDQPAGSSSLSLAETLADCDALVAADLCRTDLPPVVPDQMPLLTWITNGRIGRYDSAHPADALLLADPSFQGVALSAGWPVGRIALAAWPLLAALHLPLLSSPDRLKPELRTKACTAGLAIIADTIPIAPPMAEFDYSSHRLLWELIEHELAKDPFILSAAVGEFLDGRMRRLSIGAEGLDRRMFAERLILPAYQQGLARTLIQAGLPVRLFGAGWDAIPDLASHAAGAIRSRQHLVEVAAASAALVHVWPARHAHPIDALGRPVVRRSASAGAFTRTARAALSDAAPLESATPTLSVATLLRLLGA